jgi:glycopeptide antibiotics resistance protein
MNFQAIIFNTMADLLINLSAGWLALLVALPLFPSKQRRAANFSSLDFRVNLAFTLSLIALALLGLVIYVYRPL